MQVRILGAHQSAALDQHFTSILIDGTLAVDAGSLASALTLEEQFRVRDVLITHQHWDHVKDLPGFGYNLYSGRENGYGPGRVGLHCTEEVRQVLADRFFVPGFWMDFFALPSTDDPTFAYHAVDDASEFCIGPFRVRPVPVNHSVPTRGYVIADAAGRTLYFTSDNGPGCGRAWATTRPDVLITECTYSNELAQLDSGKMFGHLCPAQLGVELEVFAGAHSYFPRVIVLHVNPFQEGRVRDELADVGSKLGASVEVSADGQTFEV